MIRKFLFNSKNVKKSLKELMRKVLELEYENRKLIRTYTKLRSYKEKKQKLLVS